MSHPIPPRHNRRTSTVALVLVPAALLAGRDDPNTGQPANLSPAPAPVDVQDTPRASDMNVEFSASCDDTGLAYDVEPDTADAHEAARRFCHNVDTALDNADWPAGLRPLGDVAVDK